MKWKLQLKWNEGYNDQFESVLELRLTAELMPNPDFKEKLGDVWIVPGNITLNVDDDPTRAIILSVPSKKPVVLRKSNKYQVTLSSSESPITVPLEELKGWRQIAVDVEIIVVERTLNIIEPVSVPPCPISQDFRAMLALSEDESKKKFCDVKLTITPIDTQQEGDVSTFYAHKAILAARSEVFATMFSHNMLESTKNAIELKDIDSDVLKEFLIYIYTGECPRIEELAGSLLYHAEKYKLGHLKALCEEQLSYDLQVDNAARILLLADACNAEQLKRNALLYVNEHGDEVEHTKDWEEVQKSIDLLRDLISTGYKSAAKVKRQKLQ